MTSALERVTVGGNHPDPVVQWGCDGDERIIGELEEKNRSLSETVGRQNEGLEQLRIALEVEQEKTQDESRLVQSVTRKLIDEQEYVERLELLLDDIVGTIGDRRRKGDGSGPDGAAQRLVAENAELREQLRQANSDRRGLRLLADTLEDVKGKMSDEIRALKGRVESLEADIEGRTHQAEQNLHVTVFRPHYPYPDEIMDGPASEIARCFDGGLEAITRSGFRCLRWVTDNETVEIRVSE